MFMFEGVARYPICWFRDCSHKTLARRGEGEGWG